MFDFVRTHQRWLQVILLLLILPAFVLTGVATMGGANNTDVLAQVGERKITQREFASSYKNMMDNSRTQAGDQFDASAFEKPEMQAAFLTQMVNEVLFEDMASTGRMTAADSELKQALLTMPGMPTNAQGSVDVPAYEAILAQQGLTQAQHQQGVRADLIKQQLVPAYSTLNLPFGSEFIKQFFARSRLTEIKPIDLTPYMAKTNINAAQIQTYYEQNQTQFATPDVFDIEYTLVPISSAGGVSVSDEDIKSVFGKDATAEQLDKVRKDPTQVKVVIDKVVTKKRAAEIDVQVTKSPQDLGALAKAFNTNLQKAARITRTVDANTPEVFKDAKVREAILNGAHIQSKAIAPVMALDSGELLVVRVSAYQAAGTRTLDEVKAQIEQQLRTEAAVGLATQEAQASLGTLSANTSIGAAQSLSWLANGKASEAVAIKAMSLPANGLPALAVASDKTSVSLIRVIKDAPLPEGESAMVTQWAQGNWAAAGNGLLTNAYMAALRERMGVKMYPERIKLAAQ